jgi:hypothetical protein
VDVDGADVERLPYESRVFEDLYDGPDRVVVAQVVVEPQLVDAFVAVRVQKGASGSTRPGYFRVTAFGERTQVVDQDDALRAFDVHRLILPDAAVSGALSCRDEGTCDPDTVLRRWALVMARASAQVQRRWLGRMGYGRP